MKYAIAVLTLVCGIAVGAFAQWSVDMRAIKEADDWASLQTRLRDECYGVLRQVTYDKIDELIRRQKSQEQP